MAVDNLFKKPKCFLILNSSCKNPEQNLVIDAVEEFSYIALKGKTGTRSVSTHFPKRSREVLDALMRSFTDATRERSRDECRLKNWIQRIEYRVMKYAIAYRRFVDAAYLRVAYPKAAIRSVAIGSVSQICRQLENMLFKVSLKLGNVRLIPLITLEGVPRTEQVFC